MSTDAATINATYDLLTLVEQLTDLRKAGAWYVGPCPLCRAGRDRFALKQTSTGWRWYCRKCGDDRYHTAIDFVMKLRNLNFLDALHWMGGGAQSSGPAFKIQISPPPKPDPAPSPQWQERGREYIELCESTLWGSSGGPARDYLHGRGLSDTTLEHFRIGYNPGDWYDLAGAWGSSDKVYLPRGITIPCLVGGTLYYIKTRRIEAHIPKSKRFIQVSGGRPGIFGADNLRGCWLAVFVEGEFNAMVLDQEAGDLAGVVSLGSASNRTEGLDMAVWGRYILEPTHILAVYDPDDAGDTGAGSLLATLPRAKRVLLPKLTGVKDINDYHLAGGDLGKWLAEEVKRLGLLPAKPFDLAAHLLTQAEKAAAAGDLERAGRLLEACA